MLGTRLAAQLLAETKLLAAAALLKQCRRPALYVVTVVAAPLGAAHADELRRFALLGVSDGPWFDSRRRGARPESTWRRLTSPKLARPWSS